MIMGGAVLASGSFMHDGMVIVPCSSNTLAEVAHGLGDNLIARAGAVCLKERRKLIIAHREMPLSLIDIRNMETLALAGALICSPNPGFYLKPTRVEDLVDFVVGKVLDHLGVEHELNTRWQGPPAERNRADDDRSNRAARRRRSGLRYRDHRSLRHRPDEARPACRPLKTLRSPEQDPKQVVQRIGQR